MKSASTSRLSRQWKFLLYTLREWKRTSTAKKKQHLQQRRSGSDSFQSEPDLRLVRGSPRSSHKELSGPVTANFSKRFSWSDRWVSGMHPPMSRHNPFSVNRAGTAKTWPTRSPLPRNSSGHRTNEGFTSPPDGHDWNFPRQQNSEADSSKEDPQLSNPGQN